MRSNACRIIGCFSPSDFAGRWATDSVVGWATDLAVCWATAPLYARRRTSLNARRRIPLYSGQRAPAVSWATNTAVSWATDFAVYLLYAGQRTPLYVGRRTPLYMLGGGPRCMLGWATDRAVYAGRRAPLYGNGKMRSTVLHFKGLLGQSGFAHRVCRAVSRLDLSCISRFSRMVDQWMRWGSVGPNCLNTLDNYSPHGKTALDLARDAAQDRKLEAIGLIHSYGMKCRGTSARDYWYSGRPRLP